MASLCQRRKPICARVVSAAGWFLSALLAAGGFGGPEAAGQPPPAKISAVLADMQVRGVQFQPDGLNAMGLDGLSTLLDWLLPETAGPKRPEGADATVAGLIAQLGDENFHAREQATQRLYQLGSAAQAALVEAARSRDAEVSWRAVRILRAWQTERQQDVGRYVPAFAVYLAGIKDRPRLEELARRSRDVLEVGVPSGGRSEIVRQSILALARAGNDEYLEPLRPLLKHRHSQVAIFLVNAVAGAASAEYCPALILEALQSDRREVVLSAVDLTPQFPQGPSAPQIRQRLRAVFAGQDEGLKLRACRPLIHLFEDQEALDYVVKQAQGGKQNAAQRYEAISILSDSRGQGKPIPPKVLKALLAMMDPKDPNLRLTAVNALGTYGGEEVLKALIPLLADAYSPIAHLVRQRLLNHQGRDRELLQRSLTEAAEKHADEKVRTKAAELLKQLKQRPAPTSSSNDDDPFR